MKARSMSVRLVVVALAGLLVQTGIAAQSARPGSLLKMKSGVCSFRLLDATGVKPLDGATLALSSVTDGKVIVKATSDKQGNCKIDVAEGRYILSVDKLNVTIIETSDDLKITECRILVPEVPMQVGGQAGGAGAAGGGAAAAGGGAAAGGAGAAAGGGALLGTTTLIVGGAAVVVGVTTAVVVNNRRSSDSASD